MRMLIIWPLLWYLRFFARLALAINKPKIIGIAGSVGKSSTRNAIYAILQDHFKTKVISGNSETGIPLGLLGIELHSLGFFSPVKSLQEWTWVILSAPFRLAYLRNTEYAIIEMGIDEPDPPKNMEYLLTIVQPDIAISLNIAPPHLGQFEKTLEGKKVDDPLGYVLDRMADEDTKIITDSTCKVGIYNADDIRVKERIVAHTKHKFKKKLISFGANKENDIRYVSYEITQNSTQFTFAIDTKEITITLKDLLLPQDYREVFVASIAVGLQTGLSLEQIKTSLEKHFSLPKGRASIFEGIKKTTIIDSSYNASPKAVITFLQMLKHLKKGTGRPVVFLFGDMRELGNEAQQEHERVAKEIAHIVDYLYCVGPLTREFVIQEVESYHTQLKEMRWFDTAVRAGEYLQEHIPANSLILVKGSQNTIYLEEAIKFLLADKKDAQKLCRQEMYWLQQKQQRSN